MFFFLTNAFLIFFSGEGSSKIKKRRQRRAWRRPFQFFFPGGSHSNFFFFPGEGPPNFFLLISSAPRPLMVVPSYRHIRGALDPSENEVPMKP